MRFDMRLADAVRWIACLILSATLMGALAFAAQDIPPGAVYIQTQSDLDFGKVALLGPGGRIVLTPSGQRTLTGTLENLGGSYGAAEVVINGPPYGRFQIFAPTFVPLVAPMGDRFFVQRLVSEPAHFGALDANGKATVRFGGETLVPPSARQGTYRGRVAFWVEFEEDGS